MVKYSVQSTAFASSCEHHFDWVAHALIRPAMASQDGGGPMDMLAMCIRRDGGATAEEPGLDAEKEHAQREARVM